MYRRKKALFCSPMVHTFQKFAAALCAATLLSFIFLAARRVAQHSLYTSDFLPTPMAWYLCILTALVVTLSSW